MTVFSASDYDAPPTPYHVELFLKGATFWPTDAVKKVLARYSAQLAIDAAIDEFEQLSGRFPFFADMEATERVFEVDSKTFARTGIVQLGGGCVEISNVTALGSVVTLGASGGWIAKPDNALATRRPITWLKYIHHRRFLTYCDHPFFVVVLAKYGYAIKFPPIAFQAIVARAAVQLLRQSENLQSIAELSQDGFTKAYDVVGILTQKDVAQGGDKDFVTVARRYAAVVV